MNANSLSKPRGQEVHSLQVSDDNRRNMDKAYRAPKAGYGSLSGKQKMPELPAPVQTSRFSNQPADGVIGPGGVINLPAYFNGNEAGLNK